MRIETPEEAIAAARSAWSSIDQKQHGAIPIFSAASIARFEPYAATLSDGVWTVRSMSPAATPGTFPDTIVRADTGKVMVATITEPPQQ